MDVTSTSAAHSEPRVVSTKKTTAKTKYEGTYLRVAFTNLRIGRCLRIGRPIQRRRELFLQFCAGRNYGRCAAVRSSGRVHAPHPFISALHVALDKLRLHSVAELGACTDVAVASTLVRAAALVSNSAEKANSSAPKSVGTPCARRVTLHRALHRQGLPCAGLRFCAPLLCARVLQSFASASLPRTDHNMPQNGRRKGASLSA